MAVPYATECYWHLIHTFLDMGVPVYGVESQRIRWHEEMLEHYKISRESSLKVTDNLDKYKSPLHMHNVLLKIKKE